MISKIGNNIRSLLSKLVSLRGAKRRSNLSTIRLLRFARNDTLLVSKKRFLDDNGRFSARTERAFTLIEVMVTTAILSLGMVLVYNAFFISLDSFNYCSDYLAVVPLMDEKIWQVQEQLNLEGLSAQPQESGQVRVNNKEFNWYLKCVPLTGAQDLFKIDLVFSWQQGSRNKKVSRVAYAIYEKE